MIKLYVKQHNTTGLKYLGKTIQENHDAYMGSGERWLNHLRKHGEDVSTEIVFRSDDPKEIRKRGLELSEKWNIVESKEWANIKPESGDGGFVWMDEEYRKLNAKKGGTARAQQMKEQGYNPVAGRGVNFKDCPEFQKECAKKGIDTWKKMREENPEKELERRRKIGEAQKGRKGSGFIWTKERRDAVSKKFTKPLEELAVSTRLKKDPEFRKDYKDLKEAYWNQDESKRAFLYAKLKSVHNNWT